MSVWNSDDHTTQKPHLVKHTVKATDGKTVTKAEAVDPAIGTRTDVDTITAAKAFVDGVDSSTASVDGDDPISKSTKLIGSGDSNGMNTSSAKVVIYKNPTTAAGAWSADIFTV